MSMLEKESGVRLEWGVASHPRSPNAESGDAWTVEQVPGGLVVAAIDGLGHGPDAARASRRAVNTISQSSRETLDEILRRCNQALLGSRGAAISIARIDLSGQQLTWLGVGNVEGLVLKPVANQEDRRRGESLVTRGGVVGYDLPNLLASRTPFGLGAVLVFTTDGIRQGFSGEIRPGNSPQQTADQIMAGYNRGTDDALVLVVKQVWGGSDLNS